MNAKQETVAQFFRRFFPLDEGINFGKNIGMRENRKYTRQQWTFKFQELARRSLHPLPLQAALLQHQGEWEVITTGLTGTDCN